MPYSDNRLRPQVLQFFMKQHFHPATVLDVGCGMGSNYEFYKPWWQNSHWTGLEIFPRYVDQFSLFFRYQSLIIDDVRRLVDYNYDLVIFGDILEHMAKEESLQVLDKALDGAKYVLVALPLGHYPQGALENNVYETHVSEWSYAELGNREECVFATKNDVTGSFVLTKRRLA